MPRSRSYADVVIDLHFKDVDKTFEYEIPPHLQHKAEIGSVAVCPFGQNFHIGYIVDIKDEPEVAKHVELADVLDEPPVITTELIRTARAVADRYISHIGEVVRLALPPGRNRRVTKRGDGSWHVTQPRINVRLETYAALTVAADEAIASLAKGSHFIKQERVIKALSEGRMPVHLLRTDTDVSAAIIKGLEKRGLIELSKVATYREPDFHYPEELPLEVVLNDEQRIAVDTILPALDAGIPQTFLLKGVTGSGKTEVYLQAVRHVLDQGKTAIVLVPEIALTPQTVSRVRARFGDNVAVLHSGLGLGERYDQWRRIKEGHYKVVVGARSALWAPVKDLGLIVIDEEHEHTYKQDRSPRYHARYAAIARARANNCCVVLGSATPSIESMYKAKRGEYALLSLTKRVEERPLPAIEVVDMRSEVEPGSPVIFSSRLAEEMDKALKKEQKVILFLNRRGYSNYVMCRDCGLIVRCKHCDISLTYHSSDTSMRCHHCDYAEPAPDVCPDCGGTRLSYYGVGTERVEWEIKKRFPGVPVTRMDADTTARRDAHRQKLLSFKEQPAGILLGTQMIAKGLDFPDVTVVGIISADTSLALPDFRAGERTFQLLMQVAGRAGRGLSPGIVLVQTYDPDNYAIQAVVHGDYDEFFEREVAMRESLEYPPFSTLVNIGVAGRDEAMVTGTVEEVGLFLDGEIDHGGLKGIAQMRGPAPAPIARVSGRYRWHILLKAVDGDAAISFLREHRREIYARKKDKEVLIAIDVDPMSLL